MAKYARLRDKEGWTQEKIARTKGVTQSRVSERLKWHDKCSKEIKEFIQQGRIDEGHLREITQLSIVGYFSPWLTTEQLWLSLAEEAIEI